MKIIKRLLSLNLPAGRSAFLWGPRKVGKSHWIAHHLSHATVIDLLKTDVFADYASRPSLLRERYQNHKGLIVIDEVQKIPALLDEVHWLMENSGISFLLTGSSARVHEGDIRSLLALREDGPVKKCCVVCLEKEPRKIHPAIEILPWRVFLKQLWNGDFC